eukprot:TRINITY_DN99684_c0_g1_i1.p1 TRINITY_DN99684_c0_g1~~TRINITY_DN99684_c0_g1_i1.p1  ORF type:complete len:149 (-),score=11.15 TRINITY_DN99684_c0_g1_i1:111-557(-)
MATCGPTHPAPITVDLKEPAVDVSAPIDTCDIELVQQTFNRVAMLGPSVVGRVVFMNVLKLAPGAIDLFPKIKCDPNPWDPGHEVDQLVIGLVKLIATAVRLLNDLDTLVPVLKSKEMKDALLYTSSPDAKQLSYLLALLWETSSPNQ